MATPLYDAMTAHLAARRVSFHTPGHKGQAALLEPLTALPLDLTELPDIGSLYDGGDAVEAAEREAAKTFGTQYTFFSGGGCTLAIQTMLALAAKRGGRVLMARNAHRSAVHAAVLLDLSVTWCLSPDPKTVEAQLEADPSLRTVYITSPDYYGRLADVRALADVCHARGAVLLVDNAHGTHLDAFGCHPVTLGADASADSAHKTLPVLTGGAYLQIAKDGAFASLSRAEIKATMALFGSTSPSFPVLASLDLAQAWWRTDGRAAFKTLFHRSRPLFEAAENGGLAPAFERTDPVRLTLDLKKGDAACFAELLRTLGQEPEYVDSRYVVLLLSPFHTNEQLSALQRAMEEAAALPLPPSRPSPFSAGMPEGLPRRAMALRAATLAAQETVIVSEAVGRISAGTVCPCPPGVAVITAGEVFEQPLVTQLAEAGIAQVCVVK